MRKNPQHGFIALISILILSAVLLATTLSLAQFGIANRFFILNLEQKAVSKKVAEACVQIARIKVYNDPTYTVSTPVSVAIAGGTCNIYTVTVSGSNSSIKATSQNGDTISNLCVIVNNTTGDFTTWKELPTITDTCP
jgi:hypothetical protein